MCFILTITLMSYCIKRQSSGSCCMEILSLTFLITLPLLVIITAFCLLMPFFLDMRPWKKPCNCSKKCNESRVIGLIERIYPDADQFKFKCNGLNFGDNMGIILSDCFDNPEFISDKYYISSCSKYWSEQNQMHNIISYQRINEDRRSIMILETDPPLPNPLYYDYDEDQEQAEEETYFYVETNFDDSVDHVLIGWRVRDRASVSPLQEIPVVGYCIPGFPSAIVFSRANKHFTGFQTDCSPGEPIKEALVSYSQFLDQIQKNHPNVEYKSNKVVRIKKLEEIDDEEFEDKLDYNLLID